MSTSESRVLSAARRRLRGKPLPLEVTLELTHQCNLQCIHCFLRGSRQAHQFDTEHIKGVLDQLAEAGTLAVTFTGGEVLLREDFIAIAAHAQGRGLFHSVATNGTLLDGETVRALAETNPVKVEVSLYAATAADHDFTTRTPGSFDRSLRALRLLREQGIRTVVNTTVMRHNCHQVGSMQALAEQFGAYYSPDPMIAPMANGEKSSLRHRCHEEQLRQFMWDRGWKVECDRLDESGESQLGALVCSAGISKCAVSPSGDVYPCVLWRQAGGNLGRASFLEIWRSPDSMSWRSISASDLKVCPDCRLRKFCTRCPGFAYLEDGDLLGPSSEACRVAHVFREVIEVGRGDKEEEVRDAAGGVNTGTGALRSGM